mmetsp:Transcript_97733/g.258115  ORF Transcript_97733/g.258115 Transcript_97733/m.258115 type:complete len:242 (-) Transcript_97733:4-729(-)
MSALIRSELGGPSADSCSVRSSQKDGRYGSSAGSEHSSSSSACSGSSSPALSCSGLRPPARALRSRRAPSARTSAGSTACCGLVSAPLSFRPRARAKITQPPPANWSAATPRALGRQRAATVSQLSVATRLAASSSSGRAFRRRCASTRCWYGRAARAPSALTLWTMATVTAVDLETHGLDPPSRWAVTRATATPCIRISLEIGMAANVGLFGQAENGEFGKTRICLWRLGKLRRLGPQRA